MSITAVVVARAGSKRLPGKALLPFAGSTLVGHKVRTLKACPLINAVVIGSDSMDILEEGERCGAVAILRDAYHCDESRCSANEMLADMAGRVDGDVILWAHPTNPLVRSETYASAIATYREGLYEGYDSLCSVTPVRRHCWQNGKPLNFNPWAARHQLASDLAEYQFQDGAIFIQPREAMIRNQYFYGSKPVLFPVDPYESLDIDVDRDYRAALALWDSVPSAPQVHGAKN